MGWYDGDPGWGGWILMSLMMVAFWALVAVAVVALFRGTRPDTDRRNGGEGSTGVDEAHRILDERFARGEIDLEEYQARQAALTARVRR